MLLCPPVPGNSVRAKFVCQDVRWRIRTKRKEKKVVPVGWIRKALTSVAHARTLTILKLERTPSSNPLRQISGGTSWKWSPERNHARKSGNDGRRQCVCVDDWDDRGQVLCVTCSAMMAAVDTSRRAVHTYRTAHTYAKSPIERENLIGVLVSVTFWQLCGGAHVRCKILCGGYSFVLWWYSPWPENTVLANLYQVIVISCRARADMDVE